MNREISEAINLFFFLTTFKLTYQQHPTRTRPEVLFYYPAHFSKLTNVDESVGVTIVFEVLGLEDQTDHSIVFYFDETPIPLALSGSVSSVDVFDLGSSGDHEVNVLIVDGQGVADKVEQATLRFSVEYARKDIIDLDDLTLDSTLLLEASLRSVNRKLPKALFPHVRSGKRHDLQDNVVHSAKNKKEIELNELPILEQPSIPEVQLDAMILNILDTIAPSSDESFRACIEAGHPLCHMAIGYRHWYGLDGASENCGKALAHYKFAARSALKLAYPLAGVVPQSMSRIVEDSEVQPD